jgi:gliding motility-associated-like protein
MRLISNTKFCLLLILTMNSLMSFSQNAVFGNYNIFSPFGQNVFAESYFINGIINTPRVDPATYFNTIGPYSHYLTSDSSHVNGYAGKMGSNAYKFPVGDSLHYRWDSISAPLDSFAQFGSAYFIGNPQRAALPLGAPFNLTQKRSNVIRVDSLEYWDIDGTDSVNVILSWESYSKVKTVTGDLTKLIVVGWTGSEWASLGNIATSGTILTNGFVTSVKVIPNNYTAYTFGMKNELPKIKVPDLYVYEDDSITKCIYPHITGIDDATDSLSVDTCGGASHGKYVLVNGDSCFKYIPNKDYTGDDSVCIIICDKFGNCDSTWVKIHVLPRNDAPLITQDSVFVYEDSFLVFCPKISDKDSFDILKTDTCSKPSHGKLVQAGLCFKYVPDPNFWGYDSVCVRVCDSAGLCTSTMVRIKVLPRLDSVEVSIPEDSFIVICKDIIFTGKTDLSKVKVILNPSSGTIVSYTLPDSNCFKYKPNRNFFGNDFLTFIITDKNGLQDTVILKVIVVPVPDDILIAVDDYLTIPKNELDIKVTENDVISPLQPHTVSILIPPTNGTLTPLGNNLFRYTTTNPDFMGVDSFLYIICLDTAAGPICDSAWVYLRVSPALPNVITPNDDGKNDELIIKYLTQFPEAKVYVYNRWGDMVWINGGEYDANRFKGYSLDNARLPDGTYYYIIRHNIDNVLDRNSFLEIYR